MSESTLTPNTVSPNDAERAGPAAEVVVLSARRKVGWWPYFVLSLASFRAACMLIPYAIGGGTLGAVLWMFGPDALLWTGVVVVLAILGVIGPFWRRAFWNRWRVIGYFVLVVLFAANVPLQLCPYPSSHNDSPSQVRFRLPLDGPVTVFHGGGHALVNYHVVAPDQRWAYDLVVTKDGKSFQGDGTKLDDYYCYGLPVIAPADGIVRAVANDDEDLPPGQMTGFKNVGGNEVAIEVAPNEFLFICHMQPGSITVKPGDRITTGQVIGRVGNSGHTSEPHIHIHLQDSAESGWGEGIPLYFYNYRLNGQLIERGIPTGGGYGGQIVEHVESGR